MLTPDRVPSAQRLLLLPWRSARLLRLDAAAGLLAQSRPAPHVNKGRVTAPTQGEHLRDRSPLINDGMSRTPARLPSTPPNSLSRSRRPARETYLRR